MNNKLCNKCNTITPTAELIAYKGSCENCYTPTNEKEARKFIGGNYNAKVRQRKYITQQS